MNNNRNRQGGSQRRGPRRDNNRPRREQPPEEPWVPKTDVGKRVMAGEITDIDELFKSGKPIMEVGIVDHLLPDIQEEVVDVRRVQRTLDSGRRMRFSIMVVVGDRNGHVGVGIAKGVEAGPTIRKAIVRAKLSMISVTRACASWECGCGEPHSVPVKVTGKQGSVSVTLLPAPRGLGLVASDTSKIVLQLAGIRDVWSMTKGQTRTSINQVLAVFDALKKLSRVKGVKSEVRPKPKPKSEKPKEEPKSEKPKEEAKAEEKVVEKPEEKKEEAKEGPKKEEKPAEKKEESGSKAKEESK